MVHMKVFIFGVSIESPYIWMKYSLVKRARKCQPRRNLFSKVFLENINNAFLAINSIKDSFFHTINSPLCSGWSDLWKHFWKWFNSFSLLVYEYQSALIMCSGLYQGMKNRLFPKIEFTGPPPPSDVCHFVMRLKAQI